MATGEGARPTGRPIGRSSAPGTTRPPRSPARGDQSLDQTPAPAQAAGEAASGSAGVDDPRSLRGTFPRPGPSASPSAFASLWYAHGTKVVVLGVVLLGFAAVKGVPLLFGRSVDWIASVPQAQARASQRKVPLVMYSMDPRFGAMNGVFPNQTLKAGRLRRLAGDVVWCHESGSGAPYARNPKRRDDEVLNEDGSITRGDVIIHTMVMTADGWQETDSAPVDPPLVLVCDGAGKVYASFLAARVSPDELADAIEAVQAELAAR